MFDLITAAIGIVGKLGDKMITDEDKRIEFAYKMQELLFQQMQVLMNAKTYPWVDGLVKLSFASEQIVKGLIRPIGSLLLAGFAAYCDTHGIKLPQAIDYLLYSSPLAWGVSRHAEKKRQAHPPADEW